MFRYLKAAFWVKPRIPGLGALPVNALSVLGFTILGLGHPGFWLLGIGLETLFLFSLSTSPRFHNWVNAQAVQVSSATTEAQRQALIDDLPPDLRQRYIALRGKCAKVLDVYQSEQADAYVMDESARVLRNLKWVYLKLLVARHNVVSAANSTTEAGLTRDITALEKSLQGNDESESLKASRQATVDILKKRLQNLRRKSETLQEIDSDCTRIESQVDLILENVSMAGKPTTLSADLDFSSNLLDSSLFGESEATVHDLEKSYAQSRKVKA